MGETLSNQSADSDSTLLVHKNLTVQFHNQLDTKWGNVCLMNITVPKVLLCLLLVLPASCSQRSGISRESGSALSSGSETEHAADAPSGSVKLTGSGASFPFPLYDRWFKQFSGEHEGIRIDYQAKGSGAGIKDFTNGTVDFGASDAAMTDEEIAQVDQGVVLLPMTAGEVVFAYNLDGVEHLKLSRDAYVGILLGAITKWNNPVIQESNPDVSLPDQPITVVRRADSSGTTFVLTSHLSEVSEEWANGPGTGKTVVWPDSASFVAAPKNDGVTATITQTPGSVGYVEYGYAKLTGMHMAEIENQAGVFVAPSLESGQAALANVELPENLRAWLPDPAGEQAYPIVSYTWLLAYRKYDDPNKSEALKEVVKYCLTTGQEVSDEMGYVPLPENVSSRVIQALEQIQ